MSSRFVPYGSMHLSLMCLSCGGPRSSADCAERVPLDGQRHLKYPRGAGVPSRHDSTFVLKTLFDDRPLLAGTSGVFGHRMERSQPLCGATRTNTA